MFKLCVGRDRETDIETLRLDDKSEGFFLMSAFFSVFYYL